MAVQMPAIWVQMVGKIRGCSGCALHRSPQSAATGVLNYLFETSHVSHVIKFWQTLPTCTNKNRSLPPAQCCRITMQLKVSPEQARVSITTCWSAALSCINQEAAGEKFSEETQHETGQQCQQEHASSPVSGYHEVCIDSCRMPPAEGWVY